MKKIFTLLFAIMATITSFAQHQGGAPSAMYFVGPGNISALVFGQTASQDNASDTIIFKMNGMTSGDITLPKMHFKQMNYTVPSFTISNATFSMDMTTHAANFGEQEFTQTAKDPADGQDRNIAGTLKSASYSRVDGVHKFTLEATFSYGRMPGVITYTIDAVYDRELTNNPTAISNVKITATSSVADIYDIHGRKVATPVKGQLYIANGKKFVY